MSLPKKCTISVIYPNTPCRYQTVRLDICPHAFYMPEKIYLNCNKGIAKVFAENYFKEYLSNIVVSSQVDVSYDNYAAQDFNSGKVIEESECRRHDGCNHDPKHIRTLYVSKSFIRSFARKNPHLFQHLVR